LFDGIELGCSDGFSDGIKLGFAEGDFEGLLLGESEEATLGTHERKCMTVHVRINLIFIFIGLSLYVSF
jgi:hypothetical protein